jgi:hypothetical protein
MSTRITPGEPFPEDPGALAESEVEVLNRKLHRGRDHEYVHEDGLSPETENRFEEVNEELGFRDFISEDAPVRGEPTAIPAVQGLSGQGGQHHA